MSDPKVFPESEAGIYIRGPVGQLQVKTAAPKAEGFPVTVICCHPHPLYGGTMENKVVTTVFRTFNGMGTRALRFNYRGVGESAGTYAKAIGETEDLLAIIAWVKAVRPQDQIWLAGFSFGSYVTMRAASMTEIQQLTLIAPPVHHFDFNDINLTEIPLLIIQGDADEVVPPQMVFDWAASMPKLPTLVKLKGVTHFFHGQLLVLREILEQHYRGVLQQLL